jgi:hypothetical protein
MIATQITYCYWSEDSILSLIGFALEITVTGTLNILTLGAMDRTSGQPQVKLSLLRNISLIIRPQGKRFKINLSRKAFGMIFRLTGGFLTLCMHFQGQKIAAGWSLIIVKEMDLRTGRF